MANSIIYSGGDGGWSNNINKIIYSGPITNANIIYNNWTKNNWTKYNSINVPNNKVGGVEYKNINKWANNILNLINKWANINDNLLKIKAIYNSINVLNKWANINTLYNKVGGLINNLKNNWTIKYIKGANGILNLIKINWTKYNLKNINNKGIRIGPTHNK